jgi:hypothetical protein
MIPRIGLRTIYRGEQGLLYSIQVPRRRGGLCCLTILNEGNRLADHPRWHNALTQSCTTTFASTPPKAGGEGRLDWRLLANGHVDQLLYERRQISTDPPFTSLRAQSNITERAKAAADSPDFCTRIRPRPPDFNDP